MSWFSIVSALLQLVLLAVQRAQQKQQFDAGQEAEIAKNALAILEKTEAGKRITERINAMSPAERDTLTDALGTAGMQRQPHG